MKPLLATCLTAAALLSGDASSALAQSGLHGIDWHGPGIHQGGDDDRDRRHVIRGSWYVGNPYVYGYPTGYAYPYGYPAGYGYPTGYGYPLSYNVGLGGGVNLNVPLNGYYGYPAYGYSYPGYFYGY